MISSIFNITEYLCIPLFLRMFAEIQVHAIFWALLNCFIFLIYCEKLG